MKKLGFWAFLVLVRIFSILPFRLIYIFSDFVAFLFYNVFTYRKSMILNNLRSTFPDKSENEIKEICKKSYKNLSDILLEAIKGLSLNEKQILQRYKVVQNDKLDENYSKGQSVIGTTAHITNWEWGVYATGITLKHQIVGVYKKLSHPYINQLLINSRSKFNVILKEMKETAHYLETIKTEDPYMLVLISDQRPSDPYKAYWTTFLNRDTAFSYGAEKFCLEYNLPVFFFNIKRNKRGHYEVHVEWICENPSTVIKGDVIVSYKECLEKIILERPEDWLWSHNRWKYNKPEDLNQD